MRIALYLDSKKENLKHKTASHVASNLSPFIVHRRIASHHEKQPFK